MFDNWGRPRALEVLKDYWTPPLPWFQQIFHKLPLIINQTMIGPTRARLPSKGSFLRPPLLLTLFAVEWRRKCFWSLAVASPTLHYPGREKSGDCKLWTLIARPVYCEHLHPESCIQPVTKWCLAWLASMFKHFNVQNFALSQVCCIDIHVWYTQLLFSCINVKTC